MRLYRFYQGGFQFKRVSKRTARRAYQTGFTVIMCPSNLRPFTPYHHEHTINRKDRAHFIADETGALNDFNNLVASFEYYNCTNTQTGRYAAFYLPVKSADAFTGGAPSVPTLKTIEVYDYAYLKHSASLSGGTIHE